MHASLEVQDTPLSGSCNEFGGVGKRCCDHAEAALGDVTKSSTTIVHPAIAETVRSLALPVPDPRRGARRLGSRLAFCALVMNIAPDPHLPQADSAASMRDDNFSIPPREGAMRHWRRRNDRAGTLTRGRCLPAERRSRSTGCARSGSRFAPTSTTPRGWSSFTLAMRPLVVARSSSGAKPCVGWSELAEQARGSSVRAHAVGVRCLAVSVVERGSFTVTVIFPPHEKTRPTLQPPTNPWAWNPSVVEPFGKAMCVVKRSVC